MRAALALGLLAVCCSLSIVAQAGAQDPHAGLEGAESRAAAIQAELPGLKAQVAPLQSRFERVETHASPLRATVRSAEARVHSVEAVLRKKHLAAVAAQERTESQRSDAAEKHEKSVSAGIGCAIAALILGGIVLAWGWFRASAPVAYLVRLELGQAIGLSVGAGLLAVIVGAVLIPAYGVMETIGYAIFALGFVLPVAFVLARHSAEVQRGRATAYLRRKRMSVRVTQSLAAILGALCLLGLGTAVFAGEAKSGEVSPAVEREAALTNLSSPALVTAEKAVDTARGKVQPAMVTVHRIHGLLTTAKRGVGHAEIRLADANGDERHFENRLAALERKELREAAREERRAERREAAEQHEYEENLRKEEKELALVEQTESEESECDPNYSGCLDPNAVDYDCEGGSGDGPLYTGTVEVLGVDHYGLDEDGDGIGCDS